MVEMMQGKSEAH